MQVFDSYGQWYEPVLKIEEKKEPPAILCETSISWPCGSGLMFCKKVVGLEWFEEHCLPEEYAKVLEFWRES